MSATIREARGSDVEAALALWAALHREHEARDPRYRLSDDAAARWRTSFRDWVRSPGSRVWLGLDGGPVGLLTAHLYEPAPTYRPHLLVHVDDLYVAPRTRGTRLGTRLLEAARAWGLEAGATELRAGVLAANAAGRAFWERQGAEDYSVTVTMPVAGPDGGGGRPG